MTEFGVWYGNNHTENTTGCVYKTARGAHRAALAVMRDFGSTINRVVITTGMREVHRFEQRNGQWLRVEPHA